MGKDAIVYSAGKLADSSLTLKNIQELEAFLKNSDTKNIQDPNTKKEKIFLRQVLVLFVDTKSSLFEEMLYIFPILQTKSFAQNMSMKLADISMKGIDTKSYGISGDQALVLFENRKVQKTILDIEEIRKLVKSLNLDINRDIRE